MKETSFVVAYLSSVPWCPSCEASGVGIGGSFVGTDVARQGMTSIPDPVMERDCCSPPQEGPGGDAIPPGKRREDLRAEHWVELLIPPLGRVRLQLFLQPPCEVC